MPRSAPAVPLRRAFARSPNGMPRFDAYVATDDVEAIRAYLLVRRAQPR